MHPDETWLIILEFSGPENSKMLSQVVATRLGSSFWSFKAPKTPKMLSQGVATRLGSSFWSFQAPKTPKC